MNINWPTFAFTIGMCNVKDGPAAWVYGQAYGLEMSIDSDWPVNTIIMSPPHLVSLMTQQAEVTAMRVSAGASYAPGDGNYAQIKDAGGTWVLARPSDPLTRILDAGLGVLLYVQTPDDFDKLDWDDRLNSTNLLVAFPINSVSTLDVAIVMAASLREVLVHKRAADCQILVSGSLDHSNILEYARLPSVSGLLLLDATFDWVFDSLQQLASERCHGSNSDS